MKDKIKQVKTLDSLAEVKELNAALQAGREGCSLEPPKFEVVKTNRLKVEYFELPVVDLNRHVLIRFVEPVLMVWEVCKIPYEQNKIPHQQDLGQYVMDKWLEMIHEAYLYNNEKEDKEVEIADEWPYKIEGIDFIKCKIVPEGFGKTYKGC